MNMSITSHGMGRRAVRTVTQAQELAKRFGKEYDKRAGGTTPLTQFVSLANRSSGGRRRPVLVGSPSALSNFVSKNMPSLS